MFALLTAAVVYAAASSCTYQGVTYPKGFCTITQPEPYLLCDPAKPGANASTGFVQETDGKICQRKDQSGNTNQVCIGNGYAASTRYPCCSGKSAYLGSTLTCITTTPNTTTPQPTTQATPTPSTNLRCSDDGWEGTFSVHNATSLKVTANDFAVDYSIPLNGSETETIAALIPRLTYDTFVCNPIIPTLPLCDSTCTVNDWMQQYRGTLRYSATNPPSRLTDKNADKKIDLIDFELIRNETKQ